jgi:hypothetical protein
MTSVCSALPLASVPERASPNSFFSMTQLPLLTAPGPLMKSPGKLCIRFLRMMLSECVVAPPEEKFIGTISPASVETSGPEYSKSLLSSREWLRPWMNSVPVCASVVERERPTLPTNSMKSPLVKRTVVQRRPSMRQFFQLVNSDPSTVGRPSPERCRGR